MRGGDRVKKIAVLLLVMLAVAAFASTASAKARGVIVMGAESISLR